MIEINEEIIEVAIEETETANVNTAESSRRMMQRLQLEPGKKYRGSFWINEFGEFHCNPEQKGQNPTGMNLVSEGALHKLFTTKNTVRVVITLDRGTCDYVSAQFTQAVTKAMVDILKYNFSK